MTEHMAVNPPRSIVTDHYLLDLYNTEILERGIIGPANDTKLGVHILPMAFPWT